MGFRMDSCPFCGMIFPEDAVICRCGFHRERPVSDQLVKALLNGDSRLEALYDKLPGELVASEIGEIQSLEGAGSSAAASIILAAYYSRTLEDGKALIRWKEGLKHIDKSDADLYISAFAKFVSILIWENETKYLEFDYIAHIDKFSEECDSVFKDSYKGVVYLSVLEAYSGMYSEADQAGRARQYSIFVDLMRRICVYCRDYVILSRTISSVLDLLGFDPDESKDFEDDILLFFSVFLNRMSLQPIVSSGEDSPDISGSFLDWTDSDMKEKLEKYMAALTDRDNYRKSVEKFIKRSGYSLQDTSWASIDNYLEIYLKIRK